MYMTQPRSFSGGNAIAQNPGQQTRGMVIIKTPVVRRGERKSSKPRETNEGNGITWNPGQRRVPRRPRQQNPGYLHCSIMARRSSSRRKTFHFHHQHLEFMTLAPTRSFASPARTHETKRFPSYGGDNTRTHPPTSDFPSCLKTPFVHNF